MKQIYDNKDIGETIDKSFDAGIKEGYRRCMEQMMKEAVEGEVCHFATAHYVKTNETQLSARLQQFKSGDKVRIIIVKED